MHTAQERVSTTTLKYCISCGLKNCILECFYSSFFVKRGTDRVYGVQGGSLVKTSLKVFTLYLTLYCFIFVFAYLQFCISVGKQHLCTERHLGEN